MTLLDLRDDRTTVAHAPAQRREPVSIVTVYNDAEMRRSCLDHSIETRRDEALTLEYIAVDNAGGAFASAGAALNDGAARTSCDYVAFVHQDVYLHSLSALEQAAGMLADDPGIGLLGAIGVTADGRFIGRVRDRVFLLGEPAERPVTVDCVDELLFIIPRRVLEQEPIAEDPELAWHAYAVEYGLRVRSRGLRVCAADIPVTHNSLTSNLERLDVAYATVAAAHPSAMPVMTPQGQVGGQPRLRDLTPRALRAHRWRYRWLRESIDAHAGRRAAGGTSCVLADIRLDVDELLARLPGELPLRVVNANQGRSLDDGQAAPVALTRAGRRVLLASRTLDETADLVGAPGGGPLLITNLDLDGVRRLCERLGTEDRVLGFRTSIGYWMLIDVSPDLLPAAWRSREARPLAMPTLTA